MSTAVDTTQLAQVISSFKTTAKDTLETTDTIAFEQLESQLNNIEGYVRELQQAMWAGEAEETIRHLENHEPLTPTDKEVIRTFLVSDAEHYLAQENNYHEWVSELTRLCDDLNRRSQTVTRENIGTIRGVLRDAIRILPDIRNYVTEKKRIESFDLAVDDLDNQTRNTLIKIIREQLYTPSR